MIPKCMAPLSPNHVTPSLGRGRQDPAIGFVSVSSIHLFRLLAIVTSSATRTATSVARAAALRFVESSTLISFVVVTPCLDLFAQMEKRSRLRFETHLNDRWRNSLLMLLRSLVQVVKARPLSAESPVPGERAQTELAWALFDKRKGSVLGRDPELRNREN